MKTIVVTVRHPDWSNEHTIHEGDEVGAEVLDVDLGSSFNGKPEDVDQWEDWNETMQAVVADLPGSHPARAQIEQLVESLHPDRT